MILNICTWTHISSHICYHGNAEKTRIFVKSMQVKDIYFCSKLRILSNCDNNNKSIIYFDSSCISIVHITRRLLWLKVLWACAFLDRFFSFTLLLQNRLSLKIYWFEITCIMKHKYQFCQDYNVSDILWHLITINVLIPVIRVGKWHLFPAQSNLYLVFSKNRRFLKCCSSKW